MRIGLDFDNTIVCYDHIFHRIAMEDSLIPSSVAVSKVAVRDHLRAAGQERSWTLLQGQVYGLRLVEAKPYDGAREFMAWAARAGHQLFIISYRTRHPALGPAYDLHAAAQDWMARWLNNEAIPLIPAANQFFETSLDAKVARIAATACDLFVDDHPDVLFHAAFPGMVRRILFDATGSDASAAAIERIHHWDQLRARMEQT